MLNKRSRIILRAKLGFPKVFVGRFEAKIQVKTVAENKNYFARLFHMMV